MRIMYFGEYNIGGGVKSNISLAISASQYSDVGFLGIDTIIDNSSIILLKTKASKSISITYILDFIRALKTFNPEIVHATGMYTGLLSIFMKFILPYNYKIILTLRHTLTKFRYHFIAKRLIRILNRVDYVHYLTNYQRDLYKQYGLCPKNFMIIPNIVVANEFEKQKIEQLRNELCQKTESELLIVYVGRIIESKQLDIFIECLHRLRSRNFKVGGIIVGSDDEKYLCYLRQLVTNYHLNDHIHFTGYISHPELYIAGSDFCLFPTQHAEALPRFILESFSVGKTMVVSNHPSITNVVSNGRDVLVTSKHNPEAYAEQCIKIIKNTSLKLELENGARESYKRRFNPDIVAGQYKFLYKNALS